MLRVVGLNHESASVAIREKVAVSKADLGAATRAVGSCVFLSTCNRTEIYVLEDDLPAIARARAFFSQRLPQTPRGEALVYEYHGVTAVQHLCSVAAGLDSMVLGESQILGQVRDALQESIAIGAANPVLTRSFRTALRVGRRARHETFVGHHPVSVSRAAVELARSTVGELTGKRVLVVGAGEMGELTTQALVDAGVGVFGVLNRTVERARLLATRYGGRAGSLDEAVPFLELADIVIASTDAPEPVLNSDDVAAAMANRRDRPLHIVDIAVPRDVDPSVRGIAGVQLCDLDDLKAHCEHNRHRRAAEVGRVDAIIAQEIERLMAWWETQSALPTVVDLRARAEQVRQEELTEAFGRLRNLSDQDRAVVDDLSRALMNRLLHQPTVGLKEAGEGGRDEVIHIARELFGLGPSKADGREQFDKRSG
jgi:glutamyl-tRNA reductase